MPSQILRQMKKLAENALADSIMVEQLIFSWLSRNVQAILARVTKTSSAD